MEKGGVLSCPGIAAPAWPFLAALVARAFPSRPVVIVTENLKAQELFHQDLETWLNSGASISPSLLFYPDWDVFPHEGKLPHSDVISDRLQTLVTLVEMAGPQRGVLPVIVTNVAALLQKTFAPQDLKNRSRRMRHGDKIAPLDLIEWFEEQGYEPEAQVSQKGEIALRGGIVDVFPSASPWPARLEFFGDELESIREFDPLTQISRQEIDEVAIPPAGELGLLKRQSPSPARSSASPANPRVAAFPDYLPANAIFLFCDMESLSARADEYAGRVPANDELFISWEELQKKTGAFTTVILSESGDAGEMPQFQSLEAFRPLAEYAGDPQIAEAQRREFFNQLHRWLRQDYAIHVFCNNTGERERFEQIWRDYLGQEAAPSLEVGSLSRGFVCDAPRLVVATDAEIFGRYKIQRPRRLKSSHAQAARSALDIDFTDLEEGDLVVHVQYGIGKYLGLKNLPASTGKGGETECLVIEYAASGSEVEPPKLYVPVSEAHLVGKYVGAGKAHPTLNTLSGNRWRKAREQAERAVRDVAAEMLRIQAVRETQAGHACKPDSSWQREFENAFIYEETPDQLTAIADTKADMEKPRPMDRLICGDVGFGKTEVAIRAAFKCVMDGRQAAVLVPTTVLAQQHFNNFTERMADYP
ncbi:MAG: CarD family transcriptional regulator, partial [Limisphaerales bacterium]